MYTLLAVTTSQCQLPVWQHAAWVNCCLLWLKQNNQLCTATYKALSIKLIYEVLLSFMDDIMIMWCYYPCFRIPSYSKNMYYSSASNFQLNAWYYDETGIISMSPQMHTLNILTCIAIKQKNLKLATIYFLPLSIWTKS